MENGIKYGQRSYSRKKKVFVELISQLRWENEKARRLRTVVECNDEKMYKEYKKSGKRSQIWEAPLLP